MEQPSNPPFHIEIKFPNAMSQRDRGVILDMLRTAFKGRQFETKEEGERAIQAWIEEYLCLSTREYYKPAYGFGNSNRRRKKRRR